MTKVQAAKLVLVLFKSFPNARVDEAHAEAYESALLDLDAAVAGRAVERLRATSTFLPSIAEIRSACADLHGGPRRTGLEAYQLAVSAARHDGYISYPKFNDARLDRAIAMCGGWVEFCNTPADAAERVRFAELYDTLATRDRQDAVSGIPLPRAPEEARRLAPAPEAPLEPATAPVYVVLDMTPKPRPPDTPYRKWTAEELDAELEKRKKQG